MVPVFAPENVSSLLPKVFVAGRDEQIHKKQLPAHRSDGAQYKRHCFELFYRKLHHDDCSRALRDSVYFMAFSG
jgi:hypothetical protein